LVHERQPGSKTLVAGPPSEADGLCSYGVLPAGIQPGCQKLRLKRSAKKWADVGTDQDPRRGSGRSVRDGGRDVETSSQD